MIWRRVPLVMQIAGHMFCTRPLFCPCWRKAKLRLVVEVLFRSCIPCSSVLTPFVLDVAHVECSVCVRLLLFDDELWHSRIERKSVSRGRVVWDPARVKLFLLFRFASAIFFIFLFFRVREFRFLLGKICVAHSVAHSFIFLLCCHYRLKMESRPRARGGIASIGEVLCTSLPSETCVNQERPGRG